MRGEPAAPDAGAAGDRPAGPGTTAPTAGDGGAALAARPFLLRRHARARRITVRVDVDHGLTVTIPSRATRADARRAVVELEAWIAPRVEEWEARRRSVRSDAGLPYRGRMLRPTPEPGRRRVVRVGDELLVPEDATERDRVLRAWFRARARETVAPLLADAAATVGRPVGRLRITDTRSRWGSCSATGTVSVSWRLLLAPEGCLEYVVWHEACHLVHQHHRPTFWALLDEVHPGWREPAGWLRRHGADLRLWLPAAGAGADA
ncbi:MAG: M48 family metallopeptidase [Solirubrobacteraceae bacterium]